MDKLSFRYCPICGEELDIGEMRLLERNSVFDSEFFLIQVKEKNHPAGYCENCNRIFAEFEVTEY